MSGEARVVAVVRAELAAVAQMGRPRARILRGAGDPDRLGERLAAGMEEAGAGWVVPIPPLPDGGRWSHVLNHLVGGLATARPGGGRPPLLRIFVSFLLHRVLGQRGGVVRLGAKELKAALDRGRELLLKASPGADPEVLLVLGAVLRGEAEIGEAWLRGGAPGGGALARLGVGSSLQGEAAARRAVGTLAALALLGDPPRPLALAVETAGHLVERAAGLLESAFPMAILLVGLDALGLGEVLAREEAPTQSHFPVGESPRGGVHWVNLADPAFGHLLVAGGDGEERGEFLRTLALALAAAGGPENFKISLVGGGSAFADFAGSPFLTGPPAAGGAAAAAMLAAAAEEAGRRQEEMAALGVASLEGLLRRDPDQAPPRRIVVVAELADLEGGEAAVRRFGAGAAAAGIHLAAATGRIDPAFLTPELLAGLPGRVVFRTETREESLLLLGQPGAETLLAGGDLVARVGDQVNRFQSLRTGRELARRVLLLGGTE